MASSNPFYTLAIQVLEKHQLAASLERATSLPLAMEAIAPTIKDFLLEAISLTSKHHQAQHPAYAEQLASLYQAYGEVELSIEKELERAMSYSVEASGKMVRPLIVFASGLLQGADLPSLVLASAALEAVHIYSLIHDDLPAMDDDDFRRGKPSNHKVFGDAHAILAGDAFQSLAFALLAANQGLAPAKVLEQVSTLALEAGHNGMCWGQSLDLLSEGSVDTLSHQQQEITLQLINIHKTCCLFAAAARLGALAWSQDNSNNDKLITELAKVLYNFGMVFQIKDDILDIEGDQELLGKPLGSDLALGKLTYVSTFGMDYCKTKIVADVEKEVAFLQSLASDLELESTNHALTWLVELLVFAIQRKK